MGDLIGRRNAIAYLAFAPLLALAGLFQPACSGGRTTSSNCYSPTQNLAHAYDDGAKGCACNAATDADVCAQGVALICTAGLWQAVEDGPCMPEPKTYSPQTCIAAGGTAIASPGTPLDPAIDCASGTALGFIDATSSGWDEGGLCCAPATATAKSCGARAGNTCTASEYCAYKAGQYCGAADDEALCEPRPQACDDIYSPVCGCDQISYGNACAAALVGTGVYASGECAQAQP